MVVTIVSLQFIHKTVIDLRNDYGCHAEFGKYYKTRRVGRDCEVNVAGRWISAREIYVVKGN